eukprot:606063-Lingulodinium_polyedra.AAC.1
MPYCRVKDVDNRNSQEERVKFMYKLNPLARLPVKEGRDSHQSLMKLAEGIAMHLAAEGGVRTEGAPPKGATERKAAGELKNRLKE